MHSGNPKDKYYWTQLRAALTAGQWTSPFPAKAPNGTALSWSELFRKFNKHCRGFQDVTEVASQTHALALLLASKSEDGDQDDARKGVEFPLDLGDECALPQERIDEAAAGYDVLKSMESSNSDSLSFALAYYAYALRNPSECLSHLAKVPVTSNIKNHIPVPASTRSNNLSLQVPGAEASSSSSVGSFLSDSVSIAEISDGRSWAMTESFRSICLKGMAHEKLSRDDPQIALSAYQEGIPLLRTIESDIASIYGGASTSVAGKLEFTSFTQFRELWRWVEILIWRGIVLSARTSNIHDSSSQNSIWTWFEHYTTCSSYWPATFRTQHRSTISVLYLRALILRGRSSPSPVVITSASRGDVKPPAWLHTARSVVHEYRAILTVSTHFPRAGERNTKVEDFVDLCVAVWEASGAVGDHAGWVIDVLWWATRLTFNSYRILRHMTRLLHVSGDTDLAKRTLRLYVQVVEKAWQASDAGVGADTDSNLHWVETLAKGARMLCKLASTSPGLVDIEDAKEAGVLIEKAKTRLDMNDKSLVARVELAEAVWSSVMGLKEQDPLTRPSRLSHAHSLFLLSVETFPTSSGYYHLALSFARAGPSRDLEQAIVNAGLAVEAEPEEVRYWHLLGLLLTMTEKWKAAEEILEQGSAIGEESSSVDADESQDTEKPDNSTATVARLALPADNDVQVRDFGAAEEMEQAVNGHAIDGLPNSNGNHQEVKIQSEPSLQKALSPVYLISTDATDVPPAEDLLGPVPDHPLPSCQEVFEHALQLRMTQVVLTEYVEGAEGAGDKWVEVFSWIAEKRGMSAAQSALSMEGRPSTEIRAPSELALSPPISQDKGSSSVKELAADTAAASLTAEPSHSIPITVSPATPDDRSRQFSVDNARSEDLFADENRLKVKRSYSIDRDASKSKKVQQMLKNRVHKSQVRITTISKKIGNGVVRNGSLRRSNSTPDFHAILRPTSYQASSIHSRRRLSSLVPPADASPSESPPPPPPDIPKIQQPVKKNSRTLKENRLLSDLWLMSAATFRRLGKIEQAKGAIQEAEVKDDSNPAVWVQLGLYHAALGHNHQAIDTFHKALFISPDDVSATIHLCRLYISLSSTASREKPSVESDFHNVDLAAGMLSYLTKGVGWDVPEAWYFLAKAYGLQGRKDRERECLAFALELSESRGVRDLGTAVGWCL